MHSHPVVQYRPDIDGLRAIAVLIVVFYHAFPQALPGGFVGVDLFFVISGFLITGIILREQVAGNFTVRRFYSRRIKRIFPALLLVLVFCLGVGWLALTHDEYKQLSKHTGASALFINNFVLWRESGYFDNPAETKPLLHMWSLAVEEQFYMAWPLLLLGIRRVTEKLVPVLLFLIAASLAYGVWLIQTNPTGAFYSPLGRFWELAAGGLLACLFYRNETSGQPKIKPELMAVTGVGLLVAALVLVDKSRAFPGLWAVLPVGAACCLVASQQSSFNNRVLGNRVLVGLGLISYPLYLWHWPLLTFARIFEGGTPSAGTRLSLVAVSLLLAWLTYRFVEKNLRFNRNSRLVVGSLLATMLAVLLFSYYILANKGLPFRHHNKLNADAQTLVIGADRASHTTQCGLSKAEFPGMIWCLHDNKQPAANAAVLGDSKGEALYYGLSRESDSNRSWLMTGPVNYLHVQDNSIEQKALRRVVEDPAIEWVVLGNALRGFTALDKKTGYIAGDLSDSQVDQWVQSYSQLVDQLVASGKKVVLVVDHPTLPDANNCISGPLTPFDLLNRLVYRQPNPRCTIRYSEHLQGTAAYQRFIARLKLERPALQVFDPAALLCNLKEDTCRVTEGNSFLYSYGDHISDYASSKIAKEILPLFQ
ncbi:MAG TPA: acyltransferase family protein [Limnobacter sp.]|nr:acyltransferase family protein [Limnobacter sp.]